MKDLSQRIDALTPEQRAVFELLRKSSRKKPARPGPPPLVRRGGTEPAPLSFDQERLWFLQTLDEESVTYNNGSVTRIEGRLDVPAFAGALSEVVRRHEAWRTVFPVVAGRPVQRVLPEFRVELPVVDLRELPAERRLPLGLRLARAQVHAPFDLQSGPLLRAVLLRLGPEEHLCLLTFHHIVTDWISSQIFWKEMAALYGAAREGRPSPLPELAVQYPDFAVWQREWLQGEVLERHLDFWRGELEGIPHVLELATDRPRPLKLAGGGGTVTLALPPPVANPFRALARQEGATPFIAALTAFGAVAFLHSGQERFLASSPNANRNQPELQGLLGFFLSQLVIAVDAAGDPSFRELLGRVKKAAFGAYAHQELPFGKLVEALRPERDPSRAPLAQVSLQLLETGTEAAIAVGGLTFSEVPLEDVFPKFDLGATLMDSSEGIRGWLEYPRDLWDHTSVARMAERFEILAGAAAAAPDVPLSALPVFSHAGLHQIVAEWNDTAAAGEPPAVDRLFEERAARHPDAVAVAGDGRSSRNLTYGELNRAANRLAHHLRALGVGPEARVGLCLERGPGVLVGMLGVWKAGGAWVPLEPGYPQERLGFLIEDSGVELVVAEPSLLDRLPAVRTVCWDGLEALAGEPEGNPDGRRAAAGDLAYVLYTSGTTGLPKGVMVEHGNLAAMLLAGLREFGWREGDRVASVAPFSFDVFLLDAVGALVSGGMVDLIPLAPALDLDRLVESLRTATRFGAVTTLMRQIEVLAASGAVRADRLRTVCVGGEAVTSDLIAGIRSAFPGADLWICYGPTEAAIHCAAFKVPPEGVAGGKAMLGRPLEGAGISIRRRDGGLAPVGVPGELWVTGAGVGRSYLGRPERTAEAFVLRDGQRWYRTGDLARWLPDGNLEFTGRVDGQVKIRGFRVEPGEIEARLAEHPGVRAAAVLVRQTGGAKQLAAYVVPSEESGNGFLEEVRSWAAGGLPEHMVPSFFIPLPELPRTSNGKLDREALLAIEPVAGSADRTAPRTATEEALAEIWRDVLGLAAVGVHDNFFNLGGDSILSIQVVARARQAGWVITPQQMFEAQTIAGLALAARPAGEEAGQEAVEGEAPLTPIQRRFFVELAGVPEALHWFNQAVLLATRSALDPAVGARALAALALHHDALRLRFASGRAVHAPAAEAAASFPLTVADLSALPADLQRPALEDAADQAQTGLHLERGPLARAVLFERGAGRSGRLLLAIHHLVVDGVSWRILLEDLRTAYGQLPAVGEVRLPARTTPWKRWAELLAEHARSAEVREELDHWLSLPETRPLPVDRPAVGNGTVASRRAVTVSLSPEATAALLKEAPAAYRTQVNDLLLAALARAFSRWTGEDRLRIDLEGHGREEVVPGVDLSRTVGWFTTAVPVVLDLAGAPGPGDAIRRVKERLRAIPRKGIGFGLLRWLADGEAAERLAALPPAEVGFNYLGQLDAAFGEEGLFAPAGESPGLNQSPRTPRWTRLEVDARVQDDRLRVDWGYSVELYDEATIARLAAGFREELEALVEHCLSPEAGGFTPSDFPLAGLDQGTVDRLFDRTVEDAYPLSPLQEGMLFHTLYSPASEIYFEQMTCTLAGPLDVAAFRRAWELVAERQPVLRTSFVWEGLARPLQVVRRSAQVPVHVEDWRGRPVEEFVSEDRARRFDLARAPLMRLALLRTGEAEHRMAWSFHHILMDGWCLSLVLREVLIQYEACRTGTSAGPLAPVLPYRDYIAWLRRQDLGRAERSWRGELAGFAAPTPVPFDHPARGAAQRAEGFGERKAVLARETAAGLEALQRQGLTLNTVVQGAWAVLLSRWSGERDVVFGGVVSGRPPELPGIETAVGLFINTLPVRVEVDPGAPAAAWLRALQERQVRQRELEWTPLSEIQRWSEVPPGEPLFRSLLVFENYPLDPTLGERLSDLEVRDLAETELTNYPLTLVAALRGDFLLRLTFDHRFEEGTARRMLSHLENLLAGLAARPEGPLGELPLLSEAERDQLLREFNRGVAVPAEDSLDRLFAARAARNPGAVAVTCEGTHLTYGELDARANRLARRLRRLGVGPDVLVGLCAERSLEMVAGLLGIVKAGGAYLPLDPSYPEERLRFLLEDARAPVLLTQELWRERFAGGGAQVLCLEDASLGDESAEGMEEVWPPDRLAYAIYTSGSTGTPKGTLVTHRNVARLFAATEGWFGFGEGDVWTLFHSYAFDFSVWELWGALLYGGRLVVVPYWVSRSPEAFHRLLRDEGVTVLNQTPSAFRQLAAEGRGEGFHLRWVIFGGEALDLRSLAPWFERHGDRSPRLVNMYGITETTVHVTFRPVTREDLAEASRSPIGVPIPDLTVHLLGRDGELVPVGAPGEIHVGGPGLARGYLGRPDLTAERFVPDPFAGEPGARLYRAGDLARRLPSGDLEFLGRVDQQVKIRGFRIEPGEIEAALAAHPGVREAVVLPWDGADGDRRLAAWIVPRGEEPPPPEELRGFLEARLPSWMVPAAFVPLDSLPLTPQGKLDRRALPAPGAAVASPEGTAPGTPAVEALAGIWEEVLGVERVGVHDNFFALGGDSILSIQAVSRARRAGWVITPQQIFEQQTIAAVAALARPVGEEEPAPAQVAARLDAEAIERLRDASVEDLYPLSPLQHGLLFHALYSPDSELYFEQMTCTLAGPLDVEAFARAWQTVVDRQPVLRTAFVWEGLAEPLQLVRRAAEVPWVREDWREAPAAEVAERMRAFLAADRARGFDLAAPPLMRLALLRTGDEEHRLVWSFHHLLVDGWCLPLLFREVLLLYGSPSAPLEPVRPYREYIDWLGRQDLGMAEAFWRARLAGLEERTPLPFDHPGREAARRADDFQEARAILPAGTAAALQAAARERSLTLNTLVQGAWALLLSRSGGGRDVVFGGVVSGRPAELPGVETMIGLFINTLPVRVEIEPGAAAAPWLRRLQEEQAGQRRYEWSPLSEVQRWSGLPAGESLFDSLLVFENYPLDRSVAGLLSDLEIRDMAVTERTNYPLMLVVTARDAVALHLTFDRRFEAATGRRMLGHLETLLAGLAARPEEPLWTLPLLSAAERHQLLAEWTGGAAFAAEEGLDRLFAAQVGRNPQAVAVTCEGERLTYGELDARANRLARRLRRMGAGPEVLVGLCVERSLELVVGILGILKAGAAYVPLDPSYPAERLVSTLADAGAPLLVTQERWRDRLPEGAAQVLCLDGEALEGESAEDPGERFSADRLAYVIYTSGTTGGPKGTPVTHRNVARLLAATEEWFGFGEDDVWTLFHSFAFDFSVWELWGALAYGGRLVVVPWWVSREPEAFLSLLREEGVTVLNQTPSAFRQLVGVEEEMAPPALRLRWVIFGGEALDLRSLAPWFERHGDRCPRLVNMYGITETTVHVTFRPVTREDLAAASRSPIGVPIPDLSVHLLGRDGELVPLGAPGEIHVGGPGLARGYLGRPDLTAERFVPDPFAADPGARLYRAGDLARRLPTGELQYLGRVDHQVKIRGFRIEPGEIEAALTAHPQVREAVVLPREGPDGERRLMAWVVPRGEEPPSGADLRSFLEARLPSWMIPAAFVRVGALPLTPQGKLDRRALPVPDREGEGDETAPRTPAEEALAAIWRAALGVERVGVHDDFFALGGDSILSLQVVARARQAGWVITPRQVFEQPTVAALAAVARPAGGAAPEQGAVEGSAPLTPIQRRFFANLAGVPEAVHHDNQSLLLETPGGLDPAVGARVFAALAAHHDALRLRFAKGRADHAPVSDAAASFPLARIDLSALPGDAVRALEGAADQAQRSLHLERGPLARAVLFDLGPARPGRLLLAIHHLVVDGVSWRVLLEDLQTAWRQLSAGRAARLPAKTTSWKRWAEILTEHARSEGVREELSSWVSLPAVRPLPLDRPVAGAGTVASRRSVSVSFSPEMTAALLRQAPAAYRTQVNDLLLAALARAFSRWTGEERVRLDLEGHGREEVVPGVDLSRTVGWFTTLFPVVLDLAGARGPGDAIRRVKERLREIPRKGIGFGLLRWLGSEEDSGRLAALPAAEIAFNYLGQLDAALGAEALFKAARESAGLARSPRAPRWYRIEVDSLVLDDRLRVDWAYSEELHDRATIERLADGFRDALEELVAHCLSPGAGGFTPSDFPLARLDQATIDRLLDRSVEDVYPLSPAQEGMLFHSLYAPGSEIYFEQIVCTLAGPLDVGAFTRAWSQVVDRQPVLRTAFAWEGLDRPVQIVRRGVRLPVAVEDWRGAPEERLAEHLAADRARGFDLSRAPLMRLALLRTGEDEHRMVWSFHHMLLDGWCLSLVFREVLTLYGALRTGAPAGPLEPVRPYRDYIAWLLRQDLGEAERFWRSELAGFTAPTPVPFDRPRAGAAQKAGDFRDARAVLPALRSEGLTLNTLVQGAWALALSRWSGEGDVVFGGVVSGRPAELPGIESAIGLFINTLPVRVGVEPGAPAGAWLRALQERQVRQRELEWSPLPEVRRWSEVPAGEPLFHSLVVFENYPLDRSLGERLAGLDVRDVATAERTNYPLTLTVTPGEEIGVEISADRRFDEATVRRLLGGFAVLLEGLTVRPEGRLEDLSPLSEAERHQLLREWIAPASLEEGCLHELFEAQAERTPAAPAVESLTYAELNRRANRLAHGLRNLGVGPEVRVALCVERSAEMIAALLGILKAGGAYVPLDPETPAERLAFLLEDSASPLLLTQSSLAGRLPETRARTLVLEDPSWQSSREDDPASGVGADHLAYVIYTSGSTGLPKGVMVRHGSAAAYVRAMSAVYGIGPGDRALQFASLSFDASVEEIFTALSRGASLAVRRGVDDPAGFLRRHEHLDVLSLPTAYWHQLAAALEAGALELPPELRLVVIGGERALPERWAAWGRTGVRLVNAYGPTEATIAATVSEHPGLGAAPEREVPIGRPLPGVAAHVLDRGLRPVPVGAPGELCLGGGCLARGYLDRPVLTAERFVPDPFGGAGERLYRTGDLVRRLADGTLEFAGRLDAQVKIRGHRVEPGEIEAALARHPAVREAAVLPWEAGGGELRLAAWVAAGETSADELRDFLSERLPASMVPAAFVLLDALPLTPQGKLDRRALPAPGRAAGTEESAGWAAPRTPPENALAAIWRDLLRVERVGVHDDFFRLGGDSILSIQVVARARQAGLSLSPRQIFEHPTVAALAALAAPAVAGGEEEGPVSGEAPLTPIQREFLDSDPVDPHHFNQALLLTTREPVDPVRLEAALQSLVRHHDALRLRFPREGAAWRQVHAPVEEAGAGFLHVDLSGLDEGAARSALEAAAAALQGSFDLARGPLLLGALFTLGSGARLLLAAHHLVVDGVSWRILLEDLEAAYARLALPAKTTSWKRWTERLAEHARSGSVREELEAWIAVAGGDAPPLPREAGAVGGIGAVSVSLPEGVTASLLREAPEAYRARVDDLLLAALARAFEGWTGQTRLRVDLEGHGREEIAPDLDLSRTVGWFTTVFPVVLDLEGASGPGDAIRRIKERLRQVPGRGLGYGLLRYLSGDPEAASRLAALPAAEVGFNNLGQLDRALGEGARWTPAEESAGPARSPRAPLDHALEVNAWVLGGRLQASWSWDASRFRKETVEALAQGFVAALGELVEHCLSPEAGGLTPSDVPLAGLDQDALDALLVTDRSVEDLHPLTPIQEGMLFTELYAPEAGIYFQQMAGTLRGPLDVAAFRRAWQAVLDRHPALRSALLWREVDRPLQAVRRGVELPWSEEDWRGETDPDGRLRDWLAADRARGIDLSRAPLMRAALLRTGGDEHRFVWSFHHVLFDGWCTALLLRDVFVAYEAFRQGREPALPPARPYRDFIAWLERRDSAGSEGFWRAYLAGFEAASPLPFDGTPDPAAPPGEEVLALPARTTAALGELARSRSLTLNTVLQGAWALLLSRWGGGPDVVFGVVVAGRPAELPGVESMVGLFINTLPARVRIEPAAPLAGWLREVQAGQLELRQHEHDPLARVQRWSELPAGEPLFHSLLAFENYPLDREALAATSGHLEVEGFELPESTEYPLTVAVLPGGRELVVRTSFGPRLAPATVRRMLRGLETILEAAAAHPDLPLEALPSLPAAERHQLLCEWSAWDGIAPRVEGGSACLHELFEAQVRRTPEAVALVAGETTLTYAELDRAANRLAHGLRGLGVGPESRVPLCVGRGAAMVAAIFGILKAGGAYVPLDPESPPDRLAFLVEDALAGSGAPLLLTDASVAPSLPQTRARALLLDDLTWAPGGAGREEAPPASGATPASLAYVIYTSGSTGVPKGVLVEHGSAAAFARTMAAVQELGAGDRAVLFSSISFDASVEDIFTALTRGAALHVREGLEDAPAFLARCREWGITHLDLPTAYWHQVAAALEDGGVSLHPELRVVEIGGERALPERWAAWGRGPGARVRLVNRYGPTEATVVATLEEHPGDGGVRPLREAPIGRPLPGVRALVLDRGLRPVPAGALGELCLGGGSLARGYFGRPALTAERFVPDPFGPPGGRLYRSGDLVRHLADGTLEFAGRADGQVKIRGVRVELGEVEAALAAHPGVREAAAGAREDASGTRRLVAFVVPRRPGDPLEDLRGFLAGRLPPALVPSEIGILEALPVTPSGKLDRRALAALEPRRSEGAGYVAPRNPMEEELAAIWAELLGVERVGVHDDFFELGGHSLLATHLVSRVRRRLGVELPLPRVFELRTLEALAREVLGLSLEEAGDLMADLDGLTDEEALALLEKEGE